LKSFLPFSIIFVLASAALLGWMGNSTRGRAVPDLRSARNSELVGAQMSITATLPVAGTVQSVNLPLVQQQAPAESPGYPAAPEIQPTQLVTQGPLATYTPTPIPVQGGEFNIPILIGVIVIIAIILLAWVILTRIRE
jgi:hypothetical protein